VIPRYVAGLLIVHGSCDKILIQGMLLTPNKIVTGGITIILQVGVSFETKGSVRVSHVLKISQAKVYMKLHKVYISLKQVHGGSFEM
jgi:hypothetical protein